MLAFTERDYGFKDVLIQPLMASRPIVAFDIGVLLGLAWLDVLDVNPHFLCPCLKFPTDVFWAIIRSTAVVCLQTMRVEDGQFSRRFSAA